MNMQTTIQTNTKTLNTNTSENYSYHFHASPWQPKLRTKENAGVNFKKNTNRCKTLTAKKSSHGSTRLPKTVTGILKIYWSDMPRLGILFDVKNVPCKVQWEI